MDGRGGCCIARYAGGGGTYGYDMSKVGKIMLRFRPIAPKPIAGGSSLSAGAAAVQKNGEIYPRCGRGKRRSINGGNNAVRRCLNKKRKASPETPETVVTLPLLRETPEPKDSPARSSPEISESPKWLSFESLANNNNNQVQYGSDPTVLMRRPPARVLGSCVTVEGVTETWTDGNGLGRTDEEKKMNLEKDTCPGFISDGFGRVTWTNRAYRKMVGHYEGEDNQLTVWLVMKERLPVAVTLTYPTFTCRVRLQYTCNGKEQSSLTLPCDVWRMDCGGFAWRLDVKAALCLGR
ncbi:hypothetical protein UlMin_007748 [Ulmus minor]